MRGEEKESGEEMREDKAMEGEWREKDEGM